MMRRPNGFTLVELLITLAITGVLFSVVGTILFQMTTISESGNSSLTVWHELQNVNHRLESDCQSALTASGGSSLILRYPDGSQITYTLSGSELQRSSGSTVNILARNISDLSFNVTDRLVRAQITATIPGRSGSSEQITSLVNLRPSAP